MMNQDELNKILADHKVWLRGDGGKRANLRGANLSCANLWGANLSRANLWGADLWGADLRCADLSRANLWGANLWGVDLRGANLRDANLRDANLWGADLRGADLRDVYLWGANLDFSCLPLWCGSKGVIVDKRIAAQIAAHFCALTCDDPDYQAARSAILEFAKTSHRAGELRLFQQTKSI